MAVLLAPSCGPETAGGNRAAGGNGVGGLPVLFEAPAFTLVDQRGDTVRSAELEGRVWTVNAFFTNCRSVCPLMTARLASLRDTLAARGWLGDRVRMLSISADPERDRPAVLREWAEDYGGSPPREWAFLTGASGPALRRLLQEGFHLSAMLPSSASAAASSDAAGKSDAAANGGYQVNHTAHVLLVDGRGRVRAVREATAPGAVDSLLVAIERLVEG